MARGVGFALAGIGILLLGLFLGFTLSTFVFAGGGGRHFFGDWGMIHHWRMMPGTMHGWVVPFGGLFLFHRFVFPLVFLFLLVLGVIWLIKATAQKPPSQPQKQSDS